MPPSTPPGADHCLGDRVVLAAVGGLVASSALMTAALSVALATVAVWLALIIVAGLTALAKGSVDAPT